MRIIFLLLSVYVGIASSAQDLKTVHSGNGISIRGLSVVNDKIIWVSGNKGAVGRSLDSGTTWKWITVKGFENNDFRDIEAFDAVTAIVMAIGEPAYMLKTLDGGENWKIVYENKTRGIFLDAMEFWNEQSGIVIGDPINGRFFISRSFDGGSSWRDIAEERLPEAAAGEACFAASGTNIRRLDLDEACFVTGGSQSRLLWKEKPVVIPITQGSESKGAYSIAVRDDKRRKGSNYYVIVGGDYKNDTLSYKNCVITKDGGKTWMEPVVSPRGYRSCVEFIDKKTLITCGTSGVDISHDGGMNWMAMSDSGFNVCRKSKDGKRVLLAGNNGHIALLVP